MVRTQCLHRAVSETLSEFQFFSFYVFIQVRLPDCLFLVFSGQSVASVKAEVLLYRGTLAYIPWYDMYQMYHIERSVILCNFYVFYIRALKFV